VIWSWWSLHPYYIDRYLEDMRALKVIDATIQPKATESIGAIESFILKLIDGGFAYRVESGDIVLRYIKR